MRRLFSSFQAQQFSRMESARSFRGAELKALIDQIKTFGPWFHNFEIAENVWTNPAGEPGPDYPERRWREVEPLLPDVRGLKCLDVGCSSGFFSLKLKEKGALTVVGIDSGEQSKAIAQAKFAAQVLKLDVDFREYSVYDLARIGNGFDLVLFMGVFYHLRHPLVALEAVRAVCSGTMIFQTVTLDHQKEFLELKHEQTQDVAFGDALLRHPQFPSLSFVEEKYGGDASCWFLPNIQAVSAMIRSCKFEARKWAFPTNREVIVKCTSV